jgi:AraC-like DNA-binding protein
MESPEKRGVAEGERTGDVGAVDDSQATSRTTAAVAMRMRRMNDSGKRGPPFSGRVRQTPVMYRGALSRIGVNAARCLALVTSRDDRMRIRAALAGIADVTFVTSVADVLHALRADRGSIRAVILDARDAAGRPTAGLARQVTQLFPTIPVVGYCTTGAESSHDIIALSTAGVHELVFKKQDDHAAMLRRLLMSAEQACAAELVQRHLRHRVPPRVWPLVEYCLQNPEDAHTVEQVAQALGLHRKTLANYCKAEGFAPPGTMVAWCLILLTTALLATPGITVERIAMQLNFPSGTALRNMLKRHTKLRPIDLRTATALREMCARFPGLDVRRVDRGCADVIGTESTHVGEDGTPTPGRPQP